VETVVAAVTSLVPRPVLSKVVETRAAVTKEVADPMAVVAMVVQPGPLSSTLRDLSIR